MVLLWCNTLYVRTWTSFTLTERQRLVWAWGDCVYILVSICTRVSIESKL
jgi:hypothetical protein